MFHMRSVCWNFINGVIKMIDLKNIRSGKLVALRPTEKRRSSGYIIWECRCDCGNVCYADSYQIKNSLKKSCGCSRCDNIIQSNISRSKYPQEVRKERLYRIWKGMYSRTHYKSQAQYKDYGERGIIICPEWENDFLTFREWALNNGYSDDLTIDRIDVNGNYEPDNCRWIPKCEQTKNQRSNIIIEYNGEKHIASEWADICGIPHSTLYKRINKGYDTEHLLKEYVRSI